MKKLDTITPTAGASQTTTTPTFREQLKSTALFAYLVLTLTAAYGAAFFWFGMQYQASAPKTDAVHIIKVSSAPKN